MVFNDLFKKIKIKWPDDYQDSTSFETKIDRHRKLFIILLQAKIILMVLDFSLLKKINFLNTKEKTWQ